MPRDTVVRKRGSIRIDDPEIFAYPAAPFQNADMADPPQYHLALDWMRTMSGRAASLDCWARGNYARRLVFNARHGISPLLVSVETVEQMRWAYRRAALLGLPVEFLWHGPLSPPLAVHHLHPADPHDVFDAGWGYVVFGGNYVRVQGRRWTPVVGYARLMPEEVGNWLIDEAGEAFAEGDAFVSPAELVGAESNSQESASLLAYVTGALSLREHAEVDALFHVELPGLDRLSPPSFNALLIDHTLELERFRMAFKRVIDSTNGADMQLLVDELNYETSELTLSERYHTFRAAVSRAGGLVTTTAAAIGATVGAATGDLATAVSASIVGAAATALCDYYRGQSEHKLELRRNPLFLVWKLGSQKDRPVQRSKPGSHRLLRRQAAPITQDQDTFFHWLAPPQAGFRLAGIRKDADRRLTSH